MFRRRRFHRAEAHLVLSAMRHRAAELGERVTYVGADTYREGLDRAARGRPVHRREARAGDHRGAGPGRAPYRTGIGASARGHSAEASSYR
ncbi:hypothetical protein SAM23877_7081 [Streptomyces ambofaciens ATCC 23877]|uniref:Uncharacterized protein n=2 Tax=Streptomyces ambofaciens TaxID=1889 RepID=A0A0K2B4C7_STRA7|nr:hypothetical protein SAM23877_7081 [Streptomyces ambofaciens ATCC 23877]ANB10335.1 hypothetical protein SAM40697_6382 [Streptomyces ambofaciens]